MKIELTPDEQILLKMNPSQFAHYMRKKQKRLKQEKAGS